jgi:hypothetical protein
VIPLTECGGFLARARVLLDHLFRGDRMIRSTCVARAIAACAVASSALVAGCNDGIECGTGALVVITAPSGDVVHDLAPAVDGTQVDVRVRTTLAQGEALSLSVTGATGAEIGTATTTAEADGSAVFAGVTLAPGKSTLSVSAMNGCGQDADSITVNVIADSGCALAILPTPADNAFYAPLQVLAAAADPDPLAPGFQATAMVTTTAGWTGEVFVTGADGQESSRGVMTAADGTAAFAIDLGEGRSSVRAECRDPNLGTSSSTSAHSVLVDTVAPDCAIAAPAPGSTITPGLDLDDDLSNGVQLQLAGAVGGGDVMGEAATFRVIAPDGSGMDLPGSAIDGSGATAVASTLAPASTPATYAIELRTHDHAGNACTAAHQEYRVVYDGCDLVVTAPTGPVTADADATPGNGAQFDASVTVAPMCAGRTVTTDCGATTATATVPADGALTMRLTACTSEPCELTEACTFKVTTTDGIQTSAGLSLVYDDQAPVVTLAVVQPAIACGAQLGPEVDIDPATDGVQVAARVTSAGATIKQVRVNNAAGSTTLDASGDVAVTLAPGANALFGVAADALGNTATTPGCGFTLADLAVSFLPPASDGLLSGRDGTVAGNQLTTSICGTVNKPGASVTLKVDGGAAQAATVTGTQWCKQVTLSASPPSHTLVASATAGTSFGKATLVVAVDVTPPGPVGNLVGDAPDRRTIHATWTAPADAGKTVDGYIVKLSTVALTDANFDTTGVVVSTPGMPKAPGATETLDLAVRAGTSYWLGVATIDAAGNRAVADIAGPLTPAFDQTGAIVPPDAATSGDVQLGWSFAHGRFNDDAFEDVAVGAATRANGTNKSAGAVYVYFGGPGGLATTPGVIIQGTENNGELGAGLAAVRWSSATRDDLVIGAPFSQGSRGRLFVFHGGATFPTSGIVDATTAPQTIGVNATKPGWFSGGALGWTLATTDFDGDGVVDLAAGAIFGGGTKGGVVVIFGGTAGAANILLSDVDASGLAGAEAQILENPTGLTSRWWGRYLFDLGKTTGVGDSILIGMNDDTGTAGDPSWIYRGAAPRTSGVTFRSFTVGTDVELDYVTADRTTAFASQAVGVRDVDGDGVRDIAVGAWQVGANDGQVVIVNGATVGTAGVAKTGDPGVVLTSINGASMQRLGVGIALRARTSADVDGDAIDDLLVAGVFGGAARLYTWYGGTIPVGITTTASAGYVLTGPSSFAFTLSNTTPPAAVSWVGDVNGDGLDDVCWSSPFDNAKDGSFELLWDDGQ